MRLNPRHNSNLGTRPMVAKLCPVYNQRMESTIEKPASSKENKALIETLSHSKMFQDYERAFSELTGLPVTLVPVESWQLPHHCKNKENPFCAMMAKKSRACAACLRVQQQLAEEAQQEPKTVACELGLCDTAVPVRLGERLIGFLRTGRVFSQRATEAKYNRMAKQVAEWGIQVDRERLRGAYYGTKVLSQRQHAAIVKLLSIFAQHIAIWSNHILTHRDNAEPPMITRAKKYIEDNQSEELSLTQVARAVNQHILFLQNVQESHRPELHRLCLPRPRRESQRHAAQPQPACERNCLRGRVPVIDPFQPRVQKNCRSVSNRLSDATGRRLNKCFTVRAWCYCP